MTGLGGLHIDAQHVTDRNALVVAAGGDENPPAAHVDPKPAPTIDDDGLRLVTNAAVRRQLYLGNVGHSAPQSNVDGETLHRSVLLVNTYWCGDAKFLFRYGLIA